MASNKSTVAKAIRDMALYYGADLSEPQFDMMVETCAKLPLEMFLKGCQMYLADTKNYKFPMPPHKVLDYMKPTELDEDTLSREAASRIIAAVTRFGWNRGPEAEEWIGELGWHAVHRYGGWGRVCELLGRELDISIFQAQVRDLCKAKMKMVRSGFSDQPIQLTAGSTNELIPAKNLVSNLLGTKMEGAKDGEKRENQGREIEGNFVQGAPLQSNKSNI